MFDFTASPGRFIVPSPRPAPYRRERPTALNRGALKGVIQPRKELSRARKLSRILVWAAFGIVLTIRFLFPPERVESRGFAQREFNQERRFRRPPARVHPPVSAVPADLWRIHIEIAPGNVDKLRGYHWSGWGGQRQQERPEVPATVREGGMVYTNVALHLKGAAGSFRPFDDKPALTLHFSKHAPGQRFHGYNKISLNNSVQDPSYLSEIISRELFEAAGVPVPKASHATVLINGRDLGLYVLTEGWGKPFLRRYFKNVGGNLYDGGFVQDISSDLDTNSGDDESDRSDLNRLIGAAMEPDTARRWQRLAQTLDLGRFLNFIALEVMTCHWDGYALNRNNYRVFHDVQTGRMVFMPHGLDQMFGVSRSSPDSTIDPHMRGMVAQAVMSTPEGRQRYLECIATLRKNVFLEEKLTNRVHELSRRIRPTLAAYAPDLAQEHDAHVAYLRQRIVERARSISDQLAGPGDPLEFDERGVARLSDWAPYQISRRRGVVRLDRAERDGRNVLQIAAGPGGGAGAWRTRVVLEAGSYRFEGKVQTREVGATGGVALRIPGTRDVWLEASDDAWSARSYDFTVTQSPAAVELICELRADHGEAWFELDSLRLIRK